MGFLRYKASRLLSSPYAEYDLRECDSRKENRNAYVLAAFYRKAKNSTDDDLQNVIRLPWANWAE